MVMKKINIESSGGLWTLRAEEICGNFFWPKELRKPTLLLAARSQVVHPREKRLL